MHAISRDEESSEVENTVLCRQAALEKFLISTELRFYLKYLVTKSVGTGNLNSYNILFFFKAAFT